MRAFRQPCDSCLLPPTEDFVSSSATEKHNWNGECGGQHFLDDIIATACTIDKHAD